MISARLRAIRISFRLGAYPLLTLRRSCEESCSWRLPRLPASSLDGAYRTPERPRGIDPVRVDLQHPVVQLLAGFRRFRKPVEIANVLAGLFDDPGIVVVLGSLVRCDHCARLERLDLVERRDPLASCLRIRLG